MTIGGQVFESLFSVFWGYVPTRGIAKSYDNSVFNFWGNGQLFPQQLHHFTFPPAVHKGSGFSVSLPTFVIFHLFIYLEIAILIVILFPLSFLRCNLKKLFLTHALVHYTMTSFSVILLVVLYKQWTFGRFCVCYCRLLRALKLFLVIHHLIPT